MQIAIDIRCLMNPTYSGVAQYTYNLLAHLFKIDNKNQYKLFYNSSQDISNNLPKFEHPNVQFYGFKYPNKLLNSGFLFLSYPEIEKMVDGCDLFFIPNPNFCTFSNRTKTILTIHDLSFEIYPHFFSLKQRLWHKIIRPHKLINKVNAVIADSANTKNDLINIYNTPEEKIKVINPGLNQKTYRPLEKNDPKLNQIREKYQLPENFILYLGTIEPRKNIEAIIEAFNLYKQNNLQNNNLNLVIAGSRGWKYQRVFKTAADSPFSDQIHFIGYVPEETKPYLYNLARLFVFPSFYEGFGLPVLEAQACGLPVIASINSSFPEVLQNSAILVNPDNLTEIARAISDIIADSKLNDYLIEKGKQNCQRFSWDKCARQTLEYMAAA